MMFIIDLLTRSYFLFRCVCLWLFVVVVVACCSSSKPTNGPPSTKRCSSPRPLCSFLPSPAPLLPSFLHDSPRLTHFFWAQTLFFYYELLAVVLVYTSYIHRLYRVHKHRQEARNHSRAKDKGQASPLTGTPGTR